MRWKISHHHHDPRHLDLLALLAFVILIVIACRYFTSRPEPTATADFIVPSQSVRW